MIKPTIKNIEIPSDEPQTPMQSAQRYVESQGGELVKQDGRVIVRLRGSVETPGTGGVDYDLVPAQGVLAKSGKWRNMAPPDQWLLVTQRVNKKVVDQLAQQVHAFVQKFAGEARANGIDPEPFLVTLADRSSSDPVDHVLQAIEQRFAHAMERQREASHAARTREILNLGDYPQSFELARRLPRRFIALLGPTNSSKTHEAMSALASAKSGVYLAPLRLLALENYERLAVQLEARGAKVSLLTGEEQRIEPDATHVASTVEMLDTRSRVEVAVIDEIQMLADRERGAAWTAAVCGAPAPVVYLVGALEARPAVEALARRLDVPLEVRVMQRKGPLEMESGAVAKVRNLRKGDAVIAFSRRDVLMWRDLITEAGMSVSTVYGNLSPEARRTQAERFRTGKTDIVVATDAIAMGLNLPIARVVFTTASKFNGIEEEELPPALAKQIAGRAGRFGIHEAGTVTGFDHDTHRVIGALLREQLDPLSERGFFVAPTLEHLGRISRVTGETSLTRLLKRFARNVDTADGFFVPRITDDQLERAEWLDTLPLPLEDKFVLSLVPISGRVDLHQAAWQTWARNLSRKRVTLLEADEHGRRQTLQEIEDLCKLYSAYAWLAYRRPEFFPSLEGALAGSRSASARVDAILAAHNRGRRKQAGDRAGKRRHSGRRGRDRSFSSGLDALLASSFG